MDTSHSIALQIRLKKAIAALELLMRIPEPSQTKAGIANEVAALADQLAWELFDEFCSVKDAETADG